MLTAVEGRVLGCLMEKERTVPDQYPLTMNALLTACNQATSRDPVLRLDEHEVLSALTSLKAGGYVRLVHPSHGRSATRYRHVGDERLGIDAAGAAVVAVLLLRGPQTGAELRARTERQHPFRSLEEVEDVLHGLKQRELARLLERTPGRKEPRWQQLVAQESGAAAAGERPVAGIAEHRSESESPSAAPAVAPASLPPKVDDELPRRVLELEARVARLEAALQDLL